MELLVLIDLYQNKDIPIEYRYNICMHFKANIKECLPFCAIYSLYAFFPLFIYEKLKQGSYWVFLFITRQGNA